jgi:hypothetical protein
MPCPICGSDAVSPLTIRSLDHLAGAGRLCGDCQAVWLVAQDTAVPEPLRVRVRNGWTTIHAQLKVAADALTDHPAIREAVGRHGFDRDAWRRGVLGMLERTVAVLVPTIREIEPEPPTGS